MHWPQLSTTVLRGMHPGNGFIVKYSGYLMGRGIRSEYLGPKFTAEMQEAWSQAYELISEQMIASK